MSDATSRRRGSSTQFDKTRQTAIKAVVGSLVAVVALLFIVLGIISWAPSMALTITHPINAQPSTAVPRNMDIWAVYPDDSVRFVTIFHPLVGAGEQSTQVDVAGPLMRRGDDEVVSSVFGGSLVSKELLPGPGADNAYVYNLFNLAYDSSGAPYGIDARVVSPPYLSYIAEEGVRKIALGAEPQSYYEQLIVAVALPPGAKFKSFGLKNPDYNTPILRPYRRARVDGWTIFYYDTTSLAERSTINIEYVTPPATVSVEEFNLFAVEAAR